MPAPTLVASYETDYTANSSPKTLSVTTQAGDRVVVCGMTLDYLTAPTAPTGNGITFSQVFHNISVGNTNGMAMWQGVDSTGGTNWTLSSTSTSSSWGISCLVFRSSDGMGDSLYNESSDTDPESMYTVDWNYANSGMLVMINDSAGVETFDVSWRARGGYTPTQGNGGVITKQGGSGVVGYHIGYYPDNGAPGSDYFGVTAGQSLIYGFYAQEIRGIPAITPPVAWISA